MTKTNITYQFRVYGSKKGYQSLDTVLEMSRILYNAALQERKEAWNTHKISIRLYDQYHQLFLIRQENEEWKKLSSGIGRGILKRVDSAFQLFFKRIKKGNKSGYPRFKGKCTIIDGIGWDQLSKNYQNIRENGLIRIKGLPLLKIKKFNRLPEEGFITARLIKRVKGWYIQFVYTFIPIKSIKTNQSIGIDVGVNQRLTLSNGEIVQRRQVDKTKENQLQRELSRCKKGSNRRKKKIVQLRRETYRHQIKNRNECHQITSDIVRRFDKIVIEKLDIKQMIEKGNKKILNKVVLLQTWGLILQQFRYKAEWAGKEIVEVNPSYTSKICSNCSEITFQNEYRIYKCSVCGLVIDRDLNAAINIRDRSFGVNRSPTLRREFQIA